MSTSTIPSFSTATQQFGAAASAPGVLTRGAILAVKPLEWIGSHWKISSLVLVVLVMIYNRMWPFHRRVEIDFDIRMED